MSQHLGVNSSATTQRGLICNELSKRLIILIKKKKKKKKIEVLLFAKTEKLGICEPDKSIKLQTDAEFSLPAVRNAIPTWLLFTLS